MTLSSLLMGRASMSLAENAAALAGRCQGPAAHAKPLFDRGFKFAPALFGSGRWSLEEAVPPSPPAVPRRRRRYGMEWSDEYSWMEKPSRETLRHLREEDAYAREALMGVRALAGSLEKEMLDRLPRDQPGIPERLGEWEYRTVQIAGAPMPSYVRRRISSSWSGGGHRAQQDEVILDCNELEAVHGHGKVGELKVSRCQNFLAYTVDGGGDERYSCWLKDLRNRRLLAKEAIVPEQGIGSVEWSVDGSCVLYTELNSAGRPARVMRHRLGTATGTDDEVLMEADPAAYLDISRTKDWAFALININSKASSEVYLLSPSGSSPRLVARRRQGHQYFVEHSQGHLVILSNRLGAGLELFSVRVGENEHIGERSWQLLHPREEGVELEDLDMFSACAVLYQRRSGIPQVSVLPMPPTQGRTLTSLPLPSWAISLQPGVNPDHQSDSLLIGVSSPIHPLNWLRFSLSEPQAPPELLRVESLQAGSGGQQGDTVLSAPSAEIAQVVSQGHLICKRLQARSTCGNVSVPVTVFHRSDLPLDGSAPMLMSMYGAYGISMEVDFCSHRLSLLERGWVMALAHCRGGGELGQAWHQEGRQLNKCNSLADATAVLEHLIQAGYSSPGKVALHAFSAGGLLLGHLLNSAPPGLVAAAWAQAPFVDLLTAMTDPDLPLTIHEYDEWGDPSDAEALRAIAASCPYYNSAQNGGPDEHLTAGQRQRSSGPAVLVSTAMDDSRVPYWGPAKWAARLRQGCGGPVLLQVNETGGHFGMESAKINELAEGYAFLIAAAGHPKI